MKEQRNIRLIGFLPTIGIILFIGLFVYSSFLYPGGSQVNLESVGFDWVNNYWCNLMNERAMNNMINPARPFAIAAMFVLCLSLMLFFIQFAGNFTKNPIWKIIILIFGILSMVSAFLMFTEFHDLMTTLSSIFGVLVVLGIIWEIYQSNMTNYKIGGIICIALLGLNNYIYYSQQFILFLPLLQKLTFALVLGWIIGLNFKMMRKNKSQISLK
ncbi:hypothetical protein D2V05_06140 [Flagellimonas pelagia]|jgi:hypothetical protein|nr:hypothetical protein D2V05_06140 [Allomuricauda maritima]